MTAQHRGPGSQTLGAGLGRDAALQCEQPAGTVGRLAAELDLASQARRRPAWRRDSATTGPRIEVLAAAGPLVAMAVALLLWRHRGDR